MFNVDLKENPKATYNFIVDPEEGINQETVKQLHSDLTEFDEEFDMMLNLAGHYYPPNNEKYLASIQ